MQAEPALRCPVCGAAFRQTMNCPRCGADLGPLMTLLAHAWSARRRSRQALRDGDYALAVRSAQAAEELSSTSTSRDLVGLARVLQVIAASPRGRRQSPKPSDATMKCARRPVKQFVARMRAYVHRYRSRKHDADSSPLP